MLSRPELHGMRSAVASTHWLASAAGMAMFERGGNAFDAATAAAFVIQVVEPHMNGPAGDAPIMVHDARTGQVRVICGQGPMPEAATISEFRRRGLDHVPGSGLLAACVPGAFGAWMTLLLEHGRLGIQDVLEPAIAYAEDGFPLLPKAALMIDVLSPLFRDEWAESGRTYLVNGAAPAAAARMRNPSLARTFRRIVSEATSVSGDRDTQIEAARRTFYTGFVAEAIDKFLATAEMIDSTGNRNSGLLTGSDMAHWQCPIENPVSLPYRDVVVSKPGPWSQGPVFLQQLALLSGFDIGSMGFGSARHVHTVVESAKLAFADREAWYGDPNFSDVPITELLSAEYTDQRRALIDQQASGQLRPGSPDGRTPWIPPLLDDSVVSGEPDWLAELNNGVPTVVKRTAGTSDTTCVTATDSSGNMVVATPSGGWLKSSPVVPGLGFPLGTRGQMAWLVDGHNNSLAPGKRPRTTLSPTLVRHDDGTPYLAFGTPGGDQQDQWTLNFFINHIEFGMTPQQAVEARTFHTAHVPTSFTPRRSNPRVVAMENGFTQESVAELVRRGHEPRTEPPLSLGKVCVTGLDHTTGGVLAAASQRGEQAYGVAR